MGAWQAPSVRCPNSIWFPFTAFVCLPFFDQQSRGGWECKGLMFWTALRSHHPLPAAHPRCSRSLAFLEVSVLGQQSPASPGLFGGQGGGGRAAQGKEFACDVVGQGERLLPVILKCPFQGQVPLKWQGGGAGEVSCWARGFWVGGNYRSGGGLTTNHFTSF